MALLLQEISKKAIHIIILIALIGYAIIENQFSQQTALMALVALLMLFILLEYFRLELNWKIPFFSQFIRSKERDRMFGVVYFLSATIICLAVFDFRIALAALLMTVFGDMLAAIVGKKYGTTLLFRNKTAVGSITELVVNLIVGFAVLINFTNVYVILVMALTATIVEIVVDELDDNLLVPLISGFIGQLLMSI